MTTNPTPAEFLADKATCRDGRDFALQFETMADVWEACERPEWMFWILHRTTPLTQEQSVWLAIAFAETCLDHIPEGEERPRKAIEDAKKWLKEPTEENRIAATDSFSAVSASASASAYFAAARAADAAAYAACAAAYDDAHSAVRAAYFASSTAAYAAYAAAYAASADADAALAAAKRKLCEIIRGAIPNPFK